jgi:hypothetical protein
MTEAQQPVAAHSDALQTQLAALAEMESHLRSLFPAAARALADRQRTADSALCDLRARVEAEQTSTAPATATAADDDGPRSATSPYEELKRSVREIAAGVTPPGATVLVVSRGDPELVQIEDRTGWHFPRNEEGTYAGYHPADSTEAIAHLETLRAQGAGYLVFPGTAFWWLDHYGDLAEHLQQHARRAWRDDRCAIYDLSYSGSDDAGGADDAAHQPGGSEWLAKLILAIRDHAEVRKGLPKSNAQGDAA